MEWELLASQVGESVKLGDFQPKVEPDHETSDKSSKVRAIGDPTLSDRCCCLTQNLEYSPET